MSLRVLHVASEVAPFAQSGGLADVLAGLPAAQVGYGVAAAVLVPLYRGVAAKLVAAGVTLGGAATFRLEVGVHAIDAAIRISRPPKHGRPTTSPGSHDYATQPSEGSDVDRPVNRGD